MSTTKLTLLAILTFSTLTAARAGVSPAWKGWSAPRLSPGSTGTRSQKRRRDSIWKRSSSQPGHPRSASRRNDRAWTFIPARSILRLCRSGRIRNSLWRRTTLRPRTRMGHELTRPGTPRCERDGSSEDYECPPPGKPASRCAGASLFFGHDGRVRLHPPAPAG